VNGHSSFVACALASCSRLEPAPLAFRRCALCRSVAFCCAEHEAAAWRAWHGKECGVASTIRFVLLYMCNLARSENSEVFFCTSDTAFSSAVLSIL
jgi:hypothetical protein